MSFRRCVPVSVLVVLLVALATAPSTATFSGKNGRISYGKFAHHNNTVQIFSANPDGSDLNVSPTSGRSSAGSSPTGLLTGS